MRRFGPPVLATLLLLVLAGGSVVPIGPLPRLGPFLDPANGVWALAPAANPPDGRTIPLPGLGRPASVVVDDRGVPHIFAETEADLYRVLGWLVARDRLFQLEIQTRAPAGTLTELLGPRALEADRASRAAGLAWGVERKVMAMDRDGPNARALQAYAEGVNAWIAQLGRALPLEYRLLGRRPSPWTPAHSLHLFSRMGQTLASQDPARDRLEVQALVGAAAAEALVPVNSPLQEPIQPAPWRTPREAFGTIAPPGEPDSAAQRLLALREVILPRTADGETVLGSNNWAVSPGRTRDGAALLSGDPHLTLTLPSIWYEAHLVVPGILDVAGVTLPGAPGVIIGFNRDIAWTFTNTQSDVLDLYEETVDDPDRPTRYRLDGVWRPLELRVETYRDPSGRVLRVDTLRFTHRGPMQRSGNHWVSTRWTVLEPSAELDVFVRAGQARSADEWLEVMRDYVAPTQNGLVADRAGTIAIRSSGWYPVRPDSGRGDGVFDGSTTASDWIGALPLDRYPQARNPSQGFLASANQQPVDPLADSAYLGGNWPAPFRAIRINALLRADSALTPEAIRRMQTDPGSARADALLPWFLAAADAVERSGAGHPGLSRALTLLREWERAYLPDDQRAILFELAVQTAMRRTFDELLPEGQSRLPGFSSTMTLLGLMRDPGNRWWDRRDTPDVVETRDDILAASLREALDTALVRYGDPDGGGWRWGRVWPTDIHHFLRLPSLSARGLEVSSGPQTISPGGRHGTFGASWRMVVELGEEVRAWGTYPGGQSGNPASPWYTDRIDGWLRGDLDSLRFPRAPSDLPASAVRGRMTFIPADAR
jgi:penicillin G amidase